MYGFGGVAGALAVHKAERLNRYVLAGLLVARGVDGGPGRSGLLDVDRKGWDIPWMALASG